MPIHKKNMVRIIRRDQNKMRIKESENEMVRIISVKKTPPPKKKNLKN